MGARTRSIKPIIAPKTVGRTLRTPMITDNIPQDVPDFVAELQRQEVAPTTITSYRSDLLGFARWFTDSTSETFTAAVVTPTDIRDYRAPLRTVQRRPAAMERPVSAASPALSRHGFPRQIRPTTHPRTWRCRYPDTSRTVRRESVVSSQAVPNPIPARSDV